MAIKDKDQTTNLFQLNFLNHESTPSSDKSKQKESYLLFELPAELALQFQDPSTPLLLKGEIYEQIWSTYPI